MLIKLERGEIGEVVGGEASLSLRLNARAAAGIDLLSFESLSLSTPEKIGLQ
jgi:hypothetical protein